MNTLKDLYNELETALYIKDAYESLWERYLRLFKENSDLISLLNNNQEKKGTTMTNNENTETDPISLAMAAVALEAPFVSLEAKALAEEEGERVIQTEEQMNP